MDTKTALLLWKKISTCIADEISNNEEFANKISALLICENNPPKPKKSNRRAPAKIDPFAIYEQGENILAEELSKLSISELKDIIAANGMDPANLVMRWKKREKIEKHIIETTLRRSASGEAFWNSSG